LTEGQVPGRVLFYRCHDTQHKNLKHTTLGINATAECPLWCLVFCYAKYRGTNPKDFFPFKNLECELIFGPTIHI